MITKAINNLFIRTVIEIFYEHYVGTGIYEKLVWI